MAQTNNNPQKKFDLKNDDKSSKIKGFWSKIGWSGVGYLAVAFACALTLWFYVADYDSVVEKTFYNIPVELLPPTKEDIVIESGEGKLVNVTVYGRKADVNAIKSEDINAYVDVRNAPGDGEINAEITVELPDGINLVEKNALSVTHVVVGLAIPTVKELPINVQIVSGSWDDMYEPVPECITCSKIDIIGSSSIIERVDRAVVNVDVGELEHPKLILGKKIELVDKNGDTVPLSYIKVADPNGNELANGKVDVYIQMFMEKELPVVIEFTGGIFSADDASISLSRETVKVRGGIEKIKRMESIALPIDETKIEGHFSDTVKLPDYGENVQYLEDATSVEVNIELKDVQSYRLSVLTDDIKAVNLPQGFTARFSYPANEEGDVPKSSVVMIRGYRDSIIDIYRDPMAKVEISVDFLDFVNTEDGVKEGDTFYGVEAIITFKDIQGVFTTDKIVVNAEIAALPDESTDS